MLIIPRHAPCLDCKHYRKVVWLGKDESSEVFACDAFPRGIPDVILTGKNNHRKPFPGDHGIQFEKATKAKS